MEHSGRQHAPGLVVPPPAFLGGTQSISQTPAQPPHHLRAGTEKASHIGIFGARQDIDMVVLLGERAVSRQVAAAGHSLGDLDRDGDVDTDDQAYLSSHQSGSGTPTDYPFLDLDRDGDADSDDAGEMQTGQTPTELTYSGLGNPFLFTGRLTDTLDADDREAGNDADGFRRLQDNRNRTYDPKHGRWLQRDPLGVRPDAPKGTIIPIKQYTDGSDLYEAVREL